MRTSLLVAAILLSATAVTAQAAPRDRAPGVAYIPAPSAQSPGRASVISKLQKIGKDEFAQGSGEADFDADFNYSFSVKVLLDTPALFSLDTTTYWTPTHGGAYGGRHSYLFEMKEGLEYDIGRLYRVRNPKGGLIAPVVALVVRHMDPRQLDTPQAVAAEVTKALSQGEPQLFVSKKGVEVWPESGLTWLDSPIIPWAELRPYLNEAEAKRIGWSAP